MGPVVTVLQVVVVQLLPELAAAGVQVATGVGPVVMLPQVTVADGVQVSTAPGVVQPQVVVVQALDELAVAGVQEGTEVGPVVVTGQVVVT